MKSWQLRSPQNADLIMQRIREGVYLREIAKELGCTAGAISHWIAEDTALAERYVAAKQIQLEVVADQLTEIADDSRNDYVQRLSENGEVEYVVDQEHINRARLRVDTRKWILARLMPRKYGDRVAVEHDVADDFADKLTRARARAKQG